MMWETQKTIVSAIMFKHDPVGLDCGCNSDEYDAEANALLDRIWDVGMEKGDIPFAVKDTFRQYFYFGSGNNRSLTDDIPLAVWTAITEDIWAILGTEITERTQTLAANMLAEPNDEDMVFSIF
jgi:hypothetical protein